MSEKITRKNKYAKYPIRTLIIIYGISGNGAPSGAERAIAKNIGKLNAAKDMVNQSDTLPQGDPV